MRFVLQLKQKFPFAVSQLPVAVEHLHQVELFVLADLPVLEDDFLEDREELWDAQCRRHGMPLGFRDIDRRTGTGNLSHKQPIARAVGSGARMVADLTAGFGHDACLLACLF